MDVQDFIIEISAIQLHCKVTEIQYSRSNDVSALSMSVAPPVLAQYLESRSCMWGSLLAFIFVSAICKEKKTRYFSCPSNPSSMLDQPAGNPCNLVEDSTFTFSTTLVQQQYSFKESHGNDKFRGLPADIFVELLSVVHHTVGI